MKILYNESAIAAEVKKLGSKIAADYADYKDNDSALLVIGVLKGAFVFMADLVREIDTPCEIAFMTARSYGSEMVSSGTVEIAESPDIDITGRDVIVVEDILDTGRTLNRICAVLRLKNPRSLKTCVFLDKKVARAEAFDADYVCFSIEDEFVVGYGLDYDEKYRNLPYLAVVT
ncbi:MAG: hypoxanthine phosphoribosyltransferase [Oscillospiraceae bacterium]|nr:hypoxanthine phosphoribosyltransferase [Oscillospiraceae bacterium]